MPEFVTHTLADTTESMILASQRLVQAMEALGMPAIKIPATDVQVLTNGAGIFTSNDDETPQATDAIYKVNTNNGGTVLERHVGDRVARFNTNLFKEDNRLNVGQAFIDELPTLLEAVLARQMALKTMADEVAAASDELPVPQPSIR